MSAAQETAVAVAVRIRPQSGAERLGGCEVCTRVEDERQVHLGPDKAFTFDHVFDTHCRQTDIFDATVRHLVDGTLHGYNATILAYGQTGSGKTYTMGTAALLEADDQNQGIIPRAVQRLFEGIREQRAKAVEASLPAPDFKVAAQFVELYNEEMNDLFQTATGGGSARGGKSMRVHEDHTGSIYITGVSSRPVNSVEDCAKCLQIGSLNRQTASTNMNATSSRSHAIFTLTVKQQRVSTTESTPENGEESKTSSELDFETLSAKFHFVDLAGSERLKRTGATGDRAKEGISINCGLLALGNVISALGDVTKKGSFVPYRNSKLTRLLQDSLGGNSRTLMIACISPSDRDLMETLNTLNYANRARNIKNKVAVNQDKASKQLTVLKERIAALENELLQYKQGKLTADVAYMNDWNAENKLLLAECDQLRAKIKNLQATIDAKTKEISLLKAQDDISKLRSADGDADGDDGGNAVEEMVQQYLQEMETVKSKLTEMQLENDSLRKALAKKGSPREHLDSRYEHSSVSIVEQGAGDVTLTSLQDELEKVVNEAKNDVAKTKKIVQKSASRSVSRNISFKSESNKSDVENEPLTSSNEDLHLDLSERGGRSTATSDVEDDHDDGNGSDEETEEGPTKIADIAAITEEITVKERLIEQLEKSQSCLQNLKHGYDSKIQHLLNKMTALQSERDTALTNMNATHTEGDASKKSDAVKKIQKEYESKVKTLEQELKKLRSFEKINRKHQDDMKRNEERLLALRGDIASMKREKAQLIRKLRDQGQQHREKQMEQQKQMAQLKKQQRLKDNKIKNLERENKSKNVVLQRKIEQFETLKKNQKTMSAKAAGRVVRKGQGNTTASAAEDTINATQPAPPTDTRTANKIWARLTSKINQLVENTYALSYMEREMESLMAEREKWSRERAQLQSKLTDRGGLSDLDIRRAQEELEVVLCSIEEVQEKIHERQASIVALNTAKEDCGNFQTDISSLDVHKARFLLDQFILQSIEKGVSLKEEESKVKDLEGQVTESELNKTIQQELLDFVILDEDDGAPNGPSAGGQAEINCTFIKSPEDAIFPAGNSEPAATSESQDLLQCDGFENVSSRRSRRVRTMTAEDMLFDSGRNPVEKPPSSQTEEPVNGTQPPPTLMARLGFQLEEEDTSSNDAIAANSTYVVSSTTNGYHPSELAEDNQPDISGAYTGLQTTRSASEMVLNGMTKRLTNSPIPRRSHNVPSSTTHISNENVFNRLLKDVPGIPAANFQPNNNERGTINAYRGKNPGGGDFPLVVRHVAEGHKKGVSSLHATEHNLFSGSMDRCAKVWDLEKGVEVTTLGGFPNTVTQLKYHSHRKLLFTASQHIIKIWDLSTSNLNCIKLLKSSGSSCEPREYPTPAGEKMPKGEDLFNDIAFSSCLNKLYTVSRNYVRIWDLRKLSGNLAAIKLQATNNHTAAIYSIAVKPPKEGIHSKDLIFTGSRDHNIKCYEAVTDTEGICGSLNPPHYDGVECLTLHKDWLYSASRDTSIKQWTVGDLENYRNSVTVNPAHSHWVNALTVFEQPSADPVLVSACKSGYLKVWDCATLVNRGEHRAHRASINALATNSRCVFTASADWDIRIWRSSTN